MQILQDKIFHIKQCLYVSLHTGNSVDASQMEMQLSTVQGVYDLYHHFANEKAEQLQTTWELLEEIGFTKQLESLCSMES